MNYMQMLLFLMNRSEPLRQSSLLMLLAGSVGHGDALMRGLQAYELESRGQWALKIGQLRMLLEQGYTLSAALAVIGDLLPAVTVSAIRVGEESGALPNVLIDEAQRLSKSISADGTSLAGVLTYLMALILIGGLICLLLSIFVAPKYLAISEGFGMPIPLMTRAFIWLADVFVAIWPAVVPPVLGGFGYLLFLMCRNSWRKSISGHNQFSQWWPRSWTPGILRQLSLAAASGHPLILPLDSLLMELPPGRATVRVSDLRGRVHNGEGIVSALLNSRLLTHREAVFLTSAAESQHLDWALRHTAIAIDARRRRWRARLLNLLHPLMLICLALLLLAISIAIIFPALQLVNNIS